MFGQEKYTQAYLLEGHKQKTQEGVTAGGIKKILKGLLIEKPYSQ